MLANSQYCELADFVNRMSQCDHKRLTNPGCLDVIQRLPYQ